MKKLLKYSVIGFGILVLISFIIAKKNVDSREPSTSNYYNDTVINGHNYQISEQQRKIMETFLADDFESYANGGEAIITPEYDGQIPSVVTSAQLENEYSQNEVAADSKYRNKYLFITGIVKSIDRSIGENYSLALKDSGRLLLHPTAHVKARYKDFLATLSKGQKVNLFCSGASLMMGDVSLYNCMPTDIFVKNQSVAYVNTIGDRINKGNKQLAKVLILGQYLASKLPADSACYAGNMKKCAADIDKFMTEDGLKQEVADFSAKYGIEIALKS